MNSYIQHIALTTDVSAPNILYDGNTFGWYDAEDLSTLTLDSSNYVTTWKDKLNSGRNFGNYGTKPLWDANTIIFNGTSDAKIINIGSTVPQPITAYFVFKYTSTGSMFGGTGLNELITISPSNIVTYGGGDGSKYLLTAIGNDYMILRTVFDGSLSTLQVNNNTKTTGTLDAYGMPGWMVLGDRGTLAHFAGFKIKALIVRTTNDTSQSQTYIYNFLYTKYFSDVTAPNILYDGNTVAWYDFTDGSSYASATKDASNYVYMWQSKIHPYSVSTGELISNGTFDTSTGWTIVGGWTISGGKAIFTSGTPQRMYTSTSLQNGKQYIVQFDVSTISGSPRLFISNTGGSTVFDVPYSTYNALHNDTNTWLLKCTSTQGNIALWSSTAYGTFSLDNLSIKEFTGAPLIQDLSTWQPLYTTDGLQFDGSTGTGDHMKSVSLSLVQPEMMYMVVNETQTLGVSGATIYDGALAQSAAVLHPAAATYLGQNCGQYANYNGDHSYNYWEILRILFNGSKSKFQIDSSRSNAFDYQWAFPAGVSNPGTANMVGFTLNARGSTGGAFPIVSAFAKYKEIIIRKITDYPINEQSIYNYLRNKHFGTTLPILNTTNTDRVLFYNYEPSVLYDGNTVAWYDYTQPSSLTLTDSSVSQWNDRSGNARNLNSSTNTSTWPKLTSTGVLFDGTNDYLKTSTFTYNQPSYIYMVAKFPTISVANRVFLDGYDSTHRMAGATYVSPSQYLLYAGSYGNTAIPPTENEYKIFRLFFNGTNSYLKENLKTSTAIDAGAQSGNGITIGGDYSGANNVNIEVKEMIFRSIADNANSEKDIYEYLEKKYFVKNSSIGTYYIQIDPSTVLNNPIYDGNTVAWYDVLDASYYLLDSSNNVTALYDKINYSVGIDKSNNIFANYSSPNMVISAQSDPSYGTYYNISDAIDPDPRFATSEFLVTSGRIYKVVIRAKLHSGAGGLRYYDSTVAAYVNVGTLTSDWNIYSLIVPAYGIRLIFQLSPNTTNLDIQTISVNEISGNTLYQSDPNKKPSWSSSDILFNGTNNFMKAAMFTFNQPENIYMVVKQKTWTLNDIIFDGSTLNSGYVSQGSSTPAIRGSAGTLSTQNTDLAVDTWAIMRVVFNGPSSKLQINQTTAITWDCGTSNMNGFTLGARGDGTTFFSNIQVKEIILRSGRELPYKENYIYNYLKTKYSL